jgi:drug/metabolite transporter (DMT)-like permease
MNGGFSARGVLRDAAAGVMDDRLGGSSFVEHAGAEHFAMRDGASSSSRFPNPADPDEGSSSSFIGLVLAMSSSLAIGASFIIKKRGLRRAALVGQRAGSGGYGYLKEPLWWAGMCTMIVGECANFAAYAFAPAILVTPLGALSIIVAAVLSHYLLDERLNPFGWLGCLLCVLGSLQIVLHAPEEKFVSGVAELAQLASKPLFSAYAVFAIGTSTFLAVKIAPVHGDKNLVVPLAICSLVGSLSVVSCKALGIALKLTFQGNNQLGDPNTWLCVLVVCVCVVTQMNYLNRALDVFNAAVVTPVYYVLFTTCVIFASSVMFEDYARQTNVAVASQLCGFLVILCGVFVLQVTKDVDKGGLGAPGSADRRRQFRGFSKISKNSNDEETNAPRFGTERVSANAPARRDSGEFRVAYRASSGEQLNNI